MKNELTRKFHLTGLKIKKHSPEILTAIGVVGVVASTIMACKATTKVNSVLEESKNNIDNVHKCIEKGECVTEVNGELQTVPYSEADGKRDLTIFYVKTGIDLVKLYAPSVVTGAASIGCFLTSHKIMHKRNVALAAAYTAEHLGFKEYRNRVIERFGQELDRELKYNVKAQTVEETVVDEKGKEKTVEKTIHVADPNLYSPYARFFDDGCKGWEKDATMNLFTLRRVQDYANEKLKAQGYLFLNDVYEMLGISKCREGQVVGWYYNEENPIGDNFVDFGIYNYDDPNARRFVNGTERVILLDFNVDGNILDLI